MNLQNISHHTFDCFPFVITIFQSHRNPNFDQIIFYLTDYQTIILFLSDEIESTGQRNKETVDCIRLDRWYLIGADVSGCSIIVKHKYEQTIEALSKNK